MLKEAIEKIEELAKPIILDVDNRTYAVNKNGEAQEIIPEAVYQSCLSLNSLDALVQMVKTEGTCADRPDKLYLSVKDHMTVTCFGQPQHDLRDERIFYNDTGIATTVVTNKGVSLQQNSTIRPIVKLRPYRTFQEVEQPEGLFLIRIDERGITFTEADGGMWKLDARRTIKAYLEAALKDDIDAGRVVVMM